MTQPTAKICAILLLLCSLSSCANKPVFMRFGGDQVNDDFSPDYKQGWNDGCKTGEAAYGNMWTKAFRDYTRDPTKVGNRAYESAWTDAYHFCRQSHNTNINAWDSDWWGIFTLQ